MLSDDVYRSRLRSTIECLRYWVPSISDVAHVEEESAPGFWRLAITPHTSGACPFEILLLSDQRYAVQLDGIAFEDLKVEALDDFVPLVDGISAGRVLCSRWTSASTARPLAVRMTVDLGRGRAWSGMTGPAETLAAEGVIEEKRFYLPYRR